MHKEVRENEVQTCHQNPLHFLVRIEFVIEEFRHVIQLFFSDLVRRSEFQLQRQGREDISHVSLCAPVGVLHPVFHCQAERLCSKRLLQPTLNLTETWRKDVHLEEKKLVLNLRKEFCSTKKGCRFLLIEMQSHLRSIEGIGEGPGSPNACTPGGYTGGPHG